MEAGSLDGLYQSSPKGCYKDLTSVSNNTQFSIKWTYTNFYNRCEVSSIVKIKAADYS